MDRGSSPVTLVSKYLLNIGTIKITVPNPCSYPLVVAFDEGSSTSSNVPRGLGTILQLPTCPQGLPFVSDRANLV